MRLGYYFAIFLAIAGVIYFPSVRGEFIMDDWGYITTNATILDGYPWQFWFSFSLGPDYWPLSYTFYWIFFHIFGQNPLGYHVVNILLHALNATLVLVLARRLAPKVAPWAALLFLVHPLHVQAVSWIIQFKTLLSTALALGCLIFYLEARRSLALVCFTLSLLAKSSSLSLPAVLLALTWDRTQIKSSLKTLAPFFLLGLLSGATTLWVNALNFDELEAYVFHMRWFERPLLMMQNLMFYLSAFTVPHPLAYIYPYIVPSNYAWTLGFDSIALVATAFALVRLRSLRTINIYFLCYFLLLIPCLGLVAIPNMKLSLVSDHWAYLPDVFLCLFVGALVGLLPWPKVGHALVGLAAAALSFLAFNHARTFATEESFWEQVGLLNPDSAAPLYNLGTAYDKQQRIQDAMAQYLGAIRKDPLHARAWYNLGRDYYLQGNLSGARECFNKTIEINPKITVAYISLSKVSLALMDKEKAIEIVRQGLKENPDDAELIKWLSEVQNHE